MAETIFDAVAGSVNGKVAKHITNANGEAWQFDSGLMICAKTVTETVACTQSWGQLYESTTTMDFGSWPVAFTGTPFVSGNVVDGSLASWLERFTDVSATLAGKSYIVRPTSATNPCNVHIIGIGFWK